MADFGHVAGCGGFSSGLQRRFWSGTLDYFGISHGFFGGTVGGCVGVPAHQKATGEGRLWLRATGSTMVSQAIDSFLVLYIAFYWGADWPLDRVMSVALLNYAFKWAAALVMTPLIYGVHHRIEAYLGPDLAQSMRAAAHRSE